MSGYVLTGRIVSPPHFLRDIFNKKVFWSTLNNSVLFVCLLEDREVTGKKAFTSSLQLLIQLSSVVSKHSVGM